jgi:hypothetical protein
MNTHVTVSGELTQATERMSTAVANKMLTNREIVIVQKVDGRRRVVVRTGIPGIRRVGNGDLWYGRYGGVDRNGFRQGDGGGRFGVGGLGDGVRSVGSGAGDRGVSPGLLRRDAGLGGGGGDGGCGVCSA